MKGKQNEILFSVVIPLYNKEDYILDTLNSVLNQEYQNFEVIIVNDGSTDKSLKVVESLVDPRINIFSISNSGAAEARNYGINKSSGIYVALLDADDCWKPNHLAIFFSTINKHPNEFIYCNNYEIKLSDKKVRIPKYYGLTLSNEIYIINDFFKSSLYNSIATSSTVCIRKDLLGDSPYDKRIKSGQDTDLWIRLALNNAYIFNHTITAVIKKGIENSLSISDNSNYRFILTQKYLKEEKSNESLKKFMDSNRFSVLLKCKYKRDTEKVSILRSQIDTSNLNIKQRIIMNLPIGILKKLKAIKELLINKDIMDFSIFR